MSMMDFSAAPDSSGGSDLIPHGQLAFVTINFKGLKGSKSGGRYLDLELTINEGQPFARRKIFTNIGDPMFTGNSDKYREMGMSHMKRIMEASRWGRRAGEFNADAFKAAGGYTLSAFEQLHGQTVAIKIKIEKSEGFQDKNAVADYLSPNPASGSFKDWQRLVSGQYNAVATAPAPSMAFGAPAPVAAPVAQTWGAPAVAAPVAPAPAANGAAAPTWLQQANGATDTIPF
jgi:hypothetical protein